jgi:hypothetical protein
MPAITLAANVQYDSEPRVPQLTPIASEMHSPVAASSSNNGRH